MPKEEREKKSILYWKTGLLCTFSALHRNNRETQKIKTIFLVPGALEQSSKINKQFVGCLGFRKTVCFSLALKREKYTGCFMQLAIPFVKLRAEKLRMDGLCLYKSYITVPRSMCAENSLPSFPLEAWL